MLFNTLRPSDRVGDILRPVVVASPISNVGGCGPRLLILNNFFLSEYFVFIAALDQLVHHFCHLIRVILQHVISYPFTPLTVLELAGVSLFLNLLRLNLMDLREFLLKLGVSVLFTFRLYVAELWWFVFLIRFYFAIFSFFIIVWLGIFILGGLLLRLEILLQQSL